MNLRQAKIIALEMAAANLRADVQQGGVVHWPGMEKLSDRDISKVEDAAEGLANQLATRAANLRRGGGA